MEKNNIINKLKQIITEVRVPFQMNIPSDILELSKIFKKHNYKCIIVGGAVRDSILNKTIKDFDLATDAVPDKVESMMNEAGFKTLPTGKSFGVINVFTSEGEYEIATFRLDSKENDGRRPDSVEFTNIEGDVKRRDLTINALFYDIELGEIVDLVGGLDDIKNGVIRTVGNAVDRFNEDRLRILRAVRFAGRFGSELDLDIHKALILNSSLDGVSNERIRDEFIKGLISAKNTNQYLDMINKYKLFDFIFKGLIVTKTFTKETDHMLIIANMLRNNKMEVLNKTLNTLKYSIDEIRLIKFIILLQALSFKTAVTLKRAQQISGITAEQLKKVAVMFDISDNLIDSFIKFELTVSGEEVMKHLGISQGPELGAAIIEIETDNFKKIMFNNC